MPFAWQRPAQAAAVRETIRFWLAGWMQNGQIPWATAGNGMAWLGAKHPWAGHVCGDLPIWLLMTLGEYILATKDTAFLVENVTQVDAGDGSITTAPLFSLVGCAFDYLFGTVELGESGLFRLLGCDHNDGILGALPPRDADRSQTVLSSATAVHALDRLADALTLAGPDWQALRCNATSRVADLWAAVRNATVTGQWLSRI